MASFDALTLVGMLYAIISAAAVVGACVRRGCDGQQFQS